MRFFPLLLVLSVFVVAGCAPQKSAAAAPAAASAPTPVAPAASAATAGPRVIELTCGDNMKFNVTRLEATPGEKLKLTLTNLGAMPKEAMAHNFVLLQKNADVDEFTGAAAMAKATDYVPAALLAQVIAHTKSLGPRQSDTIEFTAPTVPGEYVYLCSFPGHYLIGMKGVLVVK